MSSPTPYVRNFPGGIEVPQQSILPPTVSGDQTSALAFDIIDNSTGTNPVVGGLVFYMNSQSAIPGAITTAAFTWDDGSGPQTANVQLDQSAIGNTNQLIWPLFPFVIGAGQKLHVVMTPSIGGLLFKFYSKFLQ